MSTDSGSAPVGTTGERPPFLDAMYPPDSLRHNSDCAFGWHCTPGCKEAERRGRTPSAPVADAGRQDADAEWLEEWPGAAGEVRERLRRIAARLRTEPPREPEIFTCGCVKYWQRCDEHKALWPDQEPDGRVPPVAEPSEPPGMLTWKDSALYWRRRAEGLRAPVAVAPETAERIREAFAFGLTGDNRLDHRTRVIVLNQLDATLAGVGYAAALAAPAPAQPGEES